MNNNNKTDDGVQHSGLAGVAGSVPSMTDMNAAAWADMNLKPKYQIERLRDWANMLEKRVAEFDTNYRGYPWGRSSPNVADQPRPANGG